jgi:hypothetical protein
MSRQRSAFTNPIITTSEKKSIRITITRITPRYCKHEASECPHLIPRRLNYIQHLRTTTSSPSQSTNILAVLDACTSYHSALPSVTPSPLRSADHPLSNLVLLLRVRKRRIRIPGRRTTRGSLARGASGARRYVTSASSPTQHDFQKLTRTRALRTGVSSIGSRRRIRRAGTYISISVSVSVRGRFLISICFTTLEVWVHTNWRSGAGLQLCVWRGGSVDCAGSDVAVAGRGERA